MIQASTFEFALAPVKDHLYFVFISAASLVFVSLVLRRPQTKVKPESPAAKNEISEQLSRDPMGADPVSDSREAHLMPEKDLNFEGLNFEGDKQQLLEKIESLDCEQLRETEALRLQLMNELMKPLSAGHPAIELRSRLKSCAAQLKVAAHEERMTMPDKLVKLFSLSLLSMSVAFLLCLFALLGDNAPFTAFDPSTFFSGSGSIWSLISSLLVPFGWNMASVIPYVMAASSILQFSSMIPFVGPFIQRVLLLVLFFRFFWQLRVSLLTMFICNIGLTLVGWATICLRWNRWYSRILCISLAIALGIGIAYIEPSLAYVRSPFISLCAFLRFCDEYYL